MSFDQVLILAILAGTVGLFLFGRWRHDMVALAALLACVAAGLVAPELAFEGFGHPAVVTVACVLVLSRALQTSGAVDALARRVLPTSSGSVVGIASLTLLAAVLSAFMNNVGVLALLMPIGVQFARREEIPPGRVLMPLAFGSILGGMTTLIGTPPNLIVSGFRDQVSGETFGMFAFTPVGAAVAGAGVLFIVLVGWRLVPERKQSGVEGFESGAYITEARVRKGSKADGATLRELGALLVEQDAQIVGMTRGHMRVTAPHAGRRVHAGDILMIEAEAEALAGAISRLGLELEEAKAAPAAEEVESEVEAEQPAERAVESEVGEDEPEEAPQEAEEEPKAKEDDEIVLQELAVLPTSPLVGNSATDLLLRTRFGINLLAVSRQGKRTVARLRTLRFEAGDLLLMQGPGETLNAFASESACVPLAKRDLRIPDRRGALLSTLILALAVAGAAFGLVPAAVSFAGGVLASLALRTISPRSVYQAVDWPVVVLLGALIPVAGAMDSTGAADLLARGLFEFAARGEPILALLLVLVVTMTLSDLMNNAATAAVMCPIALSAAASLEVRSDPFLMAVAIGASCAFLTPIGHQNNTLILGPGGFRFGDYWRLGLPVELLVIAVSMPMLLLIWPL